MTTLASAEPPKVRRHSPAGGGESTAVPAVGAPLRLALGDLLAVASGCALASLVAAHLAPVPPVAEQAALGAVFAAGLLLRTLGGSLSAASPSVRLGGQRGACLLQVTALAAVLCLALGSPRPDHYAAVALPLSLAALVGWRRLLAQHGGAPTPVLAVGPRAEVGALAAALGDDPGAVLRVAGGCVSDLPHQRRAGGDVAGGPPGSGVSVPLLGGLEDVSAAVRELGVRTVVATPSTAACTRSLDAVRTALHGIGADLVLAGNAQPVASRRLSFQVAGVAPLILVRGPETRGARRALSAVLERVAAAGGLLLLGPLLLLVTLAVRATSPGPGLFIQERLGRDGVPFRVLKFRTMTVGADRQFHELAEREGSDGLFFKLPEDPRVTALGRLLRRWSIDELPQLANVVRGEMSLVGPRPLPVEVDQSDPRVARRLEVRPGITGLWQVSGRSDLSWEEAVRLDTYYVDHWSPGLDLSILRRTAGAVLGSRGAY